jgi:hypothetical protein
MNPNIINETGWMVVESTDKFYEFQTFEKAFDFQLIVKGHLMTKWYFDMIWKPEQLKKN